jgi:peptide/nickel transport system substrate-binding protein
VISKLSGKIGVVAMVVALLVSGCGGNQPGNGKGESTKGAPKPAVVTVGINSDAQSLDPVLTLDATTIRMIRNIYDTLYMRDENMKIQPWLAESDRMLDENTWEIKLRKGVKFHNGEPFNAESVKFTLDFILEPTNKALTRSLVDRVSKVEVVDEYTVKLITSKPYPTLRENLSEVFMAPMKLAKEKGMAALNASPVGTGPFKFVSRKQDAELILERYDDYFKGKAALDKVVFKVIPEVGPRVAALAAGEVDLIPDVPPHLEAQITGTGQSSIKSIPARRVIFIAFDTVNGNSPVKDVRVRQALNYGVNIPEIIDKVLEKQATLIAGPLVTINAHYNKAIPGYTYNPEKAKQLLKEAGYENGLKLTLNTPQGRYLKDKETASAIAAQLIKIGVTVEVKVNEWGAFLDGVKAGKMGDMHVLGRSDRDLDGGVMQTLFKTKATWVSFSDKELDAQLEAASMTVDPAKRKTAMDQLQQKVIGLAPWIFLWQQHDVYGVSNRIQWEPRADELIFMYQAKVK